VHAAKSASWVKLFAKVYPSTPLVVLLAGTDVYAERGPGGVALATLEAATRIVGLQPLVRNKIPGALHERLRVVLQSAEPLGRTKPSREAFEVCVLAHLREVKNPLLPARAARRLPESSRVVVLHAGRALSAGWERRARLESKSNPRWRFMGALSRGAARKLLARCRLLVVPSRAEGGANVVSEALAAGVPVLATRVAGNVGLLGTDYPGLFRSEDAGGLAKLLLRCEREPAFLAKLEAATRRLAPSVSAAQESKAWRDLLAEVVPTQDRVTAEATRLQSARPSRAASLKAGAHVGSRA